MIQALKDGVFQLHDLGGPVVLVLLAMSIIALTVIAYKLWQFSAAGVGRHKALQSAVTAWDQGDIERARSDIVTSRSYLYPVVTAAFDGTADYDRLAAEAETRFARLERGFRLLDTIAQLAPLLGLFGTVLGMISAFQALQNAGPQVDPSVLAGGIWVALLTTAVGLAVAMPVASVLSWFEARMDEERVLAERALRTSLSPSCAQPIPSHA